MTANQWDKIVAYFMATIFGFCAALLILGY